MEIAITYQIFKLQIRNYRIKRRDISRTFDKISISIIREKLNHNNVKRVRKTVTCFSDLPF